MDRTGTLRDVLSRLSPPVDFDRTVITAVAPYAMSMHQALDSDCSRIETPTGALFVKLHHNELPAPPDAAMAAQAQQDAAARGLAPEVIAHFPDLAATVFAAAGAGWRTALSTDLVRNEIRAKATSALRALHDRPLLRGQQPVHAGLDATLAAAQDRGGLALPEDAAELIAAYHAVTAETSDLSPVPLHGEILASNLLLHADGGLMFVDFDRAANGDPLYDLAALALASHLEAHELSGLLTAYGLPPEHLLRLRRWMVAQDIGFGIWGRLAHLVSPRSSIEFFKYGETRLARARGQLAELRLAGAWQ